MDVINDGYHCSGFQLKLKQKTNWAGAVLTTSVDVFPAKGHCKTPARLSFKLPAPLGFSAISVDKIELDRSGLGKIAATCDKAIPGLKIECGADLTSAWLPSAAFGLGYTVLTDTVVKFSSKLNCKDSALGLSTRIGPATFGAKLKLVPVTLPELWAKLSHGAFFVAISAKDRLAVYQASCAYKVSSNLKCAAIYTHGGKTSGNFSLGVAYTARLGKNDTALKAKVQQDTSICVALKHQLAKGITVTAGARFNFLKSDSSFGFHICVD